MNGAGGTDAGKPGLTARAKHAAKRGVAAARALSYLTEREQAAAAALLGLFALGLVKKYLL